MEREIAEIIKGFRQDSIEIEMNQEHVHKWISQFSPDTQNIILEETLHILKEWYFPRIRSIYFRQDDGLFEIGK